MWVKLPRICARLVYAGKMAEKNWLNMRSRNHFTLAALALSDILMCFFMFTEKLKTLKLY